MYSQAHTTKKGQAVPVTRHMLDKAATTSSITSTEGKHNTFQRQASKTPVRQTGTGMPGTRRAWQPQTSVTAKVENGKARRAAAAQ